MSHVHPIDGSKPFHLNDYDPEEHGKLERKEAEENRDLAKAQAEAADVVTTTRVLSYAKSTDMATTLKKFLSSRGDIIADDRSNTLIIRDSLLDRACALELQEVQVGCLGQLCQPGAEPAALPLGVLPQQHALRARLHIQGHIGCSMDMDDFVHHGQRD